MRTKKVSATAFWTIFGAVTLSAFGFIFYANNNFYQEYLSQAESTRDISVQRPTRARIEFDIQGQKRIFEGTLGGHQYQLPSALAAVVRDGKLPLRLRNGRLEVTAAMGKSSGTWKIYRNGQPVTLPLTKMAIADGDTYIFRLEK